MSDVRTGPLTRLRWIRPWPTVLAAALVGLIGAVDASTVLPLACRTNITRTGGVWIYFPDCSKQ